MNIEVGTLKEIGAQVGDVVEHEDGSHYEIRINDRGVPANWCISGMCWGVEVSESTQDYRIISRANQGPVREVTTVRKEIVPGVYGAVEVWDDCAEGGLVVEVRPIRLDRTEAADLTAAITTLTAIRNAMSD